MVGLSREVAFQAAVALQALPNVEVQAVPVPGTNQCVILATHYRKDRESSIVIQDAVELGLLFAVVENKTGRDLSVEIATQETVSIGSYEDEKQGEAVQVA